MKLTESLRPGVMSRVSLRTVLTSVTPSTPSLLTPRFQKGHGKYIVRSLLTEKVDLNYYGGEDSDNS